MSASVERLFLRCARSALILVVALSPYLAVILIASSRELFLYLCTCISVILPLSLSLYVYLSLILSLSLSLNVYLSVILSLSLSLNVYLSVILSLPPTSFVRLSFFSYPHYVSVAVSVSFQLYPRYVSVAALSLTYFSVFFPSLSLSLYLFL